MSNKYIPYFDIIENINNIKNNSTNIIKLFNKLSIDISKSIILDIGCGNGFFVFGLSKYCKNIIGIDPSIYMIKDAIHNNKILNYNNIKFINISIDDYLQSINKKFNIIIFSYSIHFMNNIYNLLIQIHNFLEDNGIIYIMEPHKVFISNKYKLKNNFDKKQLILYKTRNILNNFIKNNNNIYKLLYKKFDNKIFSIILQKINK